MFSKQNVTLAVVFLVAISLMAGCSSSHNKDDQEGGGAQGELAGSEDSRAEGCQPSTGGAQHRSLVVASLVIDPPAQIPGESIAITFTIENKSEQPITIWQSGFWPNHLLIVKDQFDQEPTLTERGRLCRDAFKPDGPRKKNIPVLVQPGTSDVERFRLDLTTLYQLAPGQYTLRITYEDRVGPTPLAVSSDPVSFVISPRE